MPESLSIPFSLGNGTFGHVTLYEETPDTLFIIDQDEAADFGESPFQLVEGKSYEYALPPGYAFEASEMIRPSRIEPHKGRMVTNTFVGAFETDILYHSEPVAKINLEIRSVKSRYRTDYRKMMEDITAKCTDLLMQQSSLIYQHFTVDVEKDSKTLYQRFVFVDSIIRSDHFSDALHRINSLPAKRWDSAEKQKNISNIRKVDSSVVRQMVSRGNRTSLPGTHPLRRKFPSLPDKVRVTDNIETTDIPENRFIKYVIETFMQFCLSIADHPGADPRLKKNATASAELLGRYLSLPLFKDVSQLDRIPLHSPVLQRKEGYREILQAYLMFDMAASLIWHGGDEVYKGGKRDVAILYEYWLFFKLLDLMEEVFHIKPKPIDQIIVPTAGGLELTLKQGQLKMIDGIYHAGNRSLHIEFCYNRTFRGIDRYPAGGSWTRDMRPDYTLSIRPAGITREEAEEREMITYIHFDAKYKIDTYKSIFTNTDQDEEKKEQAKGNYKRADLLKMHAYKDAIRRTAGAYILYPGTEKKTFQAFHELLPGLGAFAVSPASDNDSGLKAFLVHVAEHFLNSASQQERFAYHTYDTFKDMPGPVLNDPLPHPGRTEPPGLTYVLVAYYKNEEHLRWILQHQIYNMRTDYRRGSIKLSPQTASARYLLLHGKGTTRTHLIFRLDGQGPTVVSREYLQDKKYPSESIQPYYVAFTLKSPQPIREEFDYALWDVTELDGYKTGRNSAVPFVVTLEELMRCKCNDK